MGAPDTVAASLQPPAAPPAPVPTVFAAIALQRDPAARPTPPGLLVVRDDLVTWHDAPSAASAAPGGQPTAAPPADAAAWRARFADVILHALTAGDPGVGPGSTDVTDASTHADADAEAEGGAESGGNGTTDRARDEVDDDFDNRPCLLAHIGDDADEVRFFGDAAQLHALYDAFCAGMARCAPEDDGDDGAGGGNAVSGLFGALGALAGLASSTDGVGNGLLTGNGIGGIGAGVGVGVGVGAGAGAGAGGDGAGGDGDGDGNGNGNNSGDSNGAVLPLNVGGVAMDDERFADAEEDDDAAHDADEGATRKVAGSARTDGVLGGLARPKMTVSGMVNGNGHVHASVKENGAGGQNGA